MSRTSTPRSVLGAAGALTVGLVLAGCSGDAEETEGSTSTGPAGDAGDLRVAMVTPESTGEFYGAMYCGAQAAAEEQEMELTIQGTPETSVEALMAVLQSVLATDPDGLLLTVWDNNAFNETLSSFTESGKPLVMPDSFLSNDEYLQSIRTDNYQSSYDAALRALDDFGITEGTVLVVTDAPGNQVQSARAEGFRDALEESSDLDVLEFQYVGGDSAEASQAVSSSLAANPDLALVFSTNIGAGTGAANGIRTAASGEVVHVGFDTAGSQVAELREGGYDALIAQSPYEMGYEAMTLISQVLKEEISAEDITEQTVHAPWELVTAENVDDAEIAPFLYTTDCSAIG